MRIDAKVRMHVEIKPGLQQPHTRSGVCRFVRFDEALDRKILSVRSNLRGFEQDAEMKGIIPEDVLVNFSQFTILNAPQLEEFKDDGLFASVQGDEILKAAACAAGFVQCGCLP